MAEKHPLDREQIESEDDFSLPSTLTKKQNFFEINYNPSDILDSDSDQNLDADELSDIHTNKDEASQYSLFRKPIGNDVNPPSMANIDTHMHFNMLQQQQQQIQQYQNRIKFADIGRNKTQENHNLHTNLFVDDDELQHSQLSSNSINNMNNNASKQVDINASGALGISHNETQDNSLISPLIKLNMNTKQSSKVYDNNQRQALMKFRSHEAQIELKSGALGSTNNFNMHLQHQNYNMAQFTGIEGAPITGIDQISDAPSSFMVSNFTFSSSHNNNNTNNNTDQSAQFVTKQLQFLNHSQMNTAQGGNQSQNSNANNHSSVESAQNIQQNSGQQFQQQNNLTQQQSSFFNTAQNSQPQQQQQNQNFITDQYDSAFANPQYYQQDSNSQQPLQYQDSIFSPQSKFYNDQQLQQNNNNQNTSFASITNTQQKQTLNNQNATNQQQQPQQQPTFSTNSTPFYANQQQQQRSPQSFGQIGSHSPTSSSLSNYSASGTGQQQLFPSPMKSQSQLQFQQTQNSNKPVMFIGQQSTQNIQQPPSSLQQQQQHNQINNNMTNQQQFYQGTPINSAHQSKEYDNIFKNNPTNNASSQMSIASQNQQINQQQQQYSNQFAPLQQTSLFGQGPSIQLRKETHSPTSFLSNQSQQQLIQPNQNTSHPHSQSTSPKHFISKQPGVQQQIIGQQQVTHHITSNNNNNQQQLQSQPQQQQQLQQQSIDQQRFQELPFINLTQQDSANSNISGVSMGYKTPVFSQNGISGVMMTQFEEQQQKQLISGFEGIELNNQQQQQQQQQIQNNSNYNTIQSSTTNLNDNNNKSSQQQQQPIIQIQQKAQSQGICFGGITEQNSNNKFLQDQSQILAPQNLSQQVVPQHIQTTTMPPPGFEKVIPNPQRNNNMMQVQDISLSQMQLNTLQSSPHISIQPQVQTSTSLINPLSQSTTSIPTQYAPQLVNPFAGKTLGGAAQGNPIALATNQVMGFPQSQPAPISNNVLIDQNESILVKIMCNYEEATSQAQKLQSLKGNVIKLAINQTGSKFLQRLLDNANPQIVQFLLDEIQSHLPMVMVDNYGNYFCQELLINCSSAQRMQILERIAVDFVAICCNKKGTHTIQKFIDLVNLEAEEKFFQRVLAGHVALLSSDVQGTHVIQNIIKCFDESKRQFVFDEIYEQFVELATDYSGLSVIKIIISKTQKPENRKRLMTKLVANAIELAQNPYGNYAIQQSFEYWDKELCQDMIPQFFGKVYQLSLQKCSSNVIDKCIQNAKPEYLATIMQELINCERLNNLITNAYGNFVVQNALKFATQEERTKLAEQIEKNIPNITDSKIKQKWVTLLKKKSLGDTKGVFKSQESDTSESSLRSGKKGGHHMDHHSNRSHGGDHGKNSKKSQGGNFGNPGFIPNQNQGTMLPPSNRPQGAFGTGYYNQNQQQQMMMQHQHVANQNQQIMYGGPGGAQAYYNPQMQMFVQPPQQNQQMIMGKQGQNNQMLVGTGSGGYLVHPQGYLIQQPSQMAPGGYQQNLNTNAYQTQMQQFGQSQYQSNLPHQYDPLGVPTDQSILGKRPLNQTQIQNAQHLQQFQQQQPNQIHQASQGMPQYQQQQQQIHNMMQSQVAANTQLQNNNNMMQSQQQLQQHQQPILSNNSQQQQFINNNQQQQQQYQGQLMNGLEYRRFAHSNTQ